MPTSTRSRKGKTLGQIEIEARERENEALHLRREGLDYGTIAQKVGWATEGGARLAVQRALNRFAEPDAAALRDIEDDKLRDLERELRVQLRQPHVRVSQYGKVVCGDDGKPLPDPMPVVAIVRELRQLSERRAKLRGLDAPMRVIVEEVTQTAVDAEAQRIMAEMALADRTQAEREQQRTEASN